MRDPVQVARYAAGGDAAAALAVLAARSFPLDRVQIAPGGLLMAERDVAEAVFLLLLQARRLPKQVRLRSFRAALAAAAVLVLVAAVAGMVLSRTAQTPDSASLSRMAFTARAWSEWPALRAHAGTGLGRGPLGWGGRPVQRRTPLHGGRR